MLDPFGQAKPHIQFYGFWCTSVRLEMAQFIFEHKILNFYYWFIIIFSACIVKCQQINWQMHFVFLVLFLAFYGGLRCPISAKCLHVCVHDQAFTICSILFNLEQLLSLNFWKTMHFVICIWQGEAMGGSVQMKRMRGRESERAWIVKRTGIATSPQL